MLRLLPRRRWAAALAVLTVAFTAGGCDAGGGDDDTATIGRPPPSSEPQIRIGAKNFTEQRILGELYSRALRAKGFDVVLKLDVGSSEIIHRALARGSLDMYPEYIGVLLSEVADVRRRPRSATAAYEAAQAYEQKQGFRLLAQTPFSDSNALGVKPQFAARHRLRTIGDLAKLKRIVSIGALAEFATRYEGLVGLREVYGLRRLKVVSMASEGRYRALAQGDVDVASVFTTEGQLAGDEHVVLADPRGLFASGHVAPIVSAKLLATHGPSLQETIDAVTGALTTIAMRQMNAAVDLGGRRPADVAAAFLRARGLV